MRKAQNSALLMIRKFYIAAILLLILTPACAVFRSGNKSESESLALKQELDQNKTAINTEQTREVKFFYVDSGKSSLEVKITPDGEFYYSPEAGFKGKAHSLHIKGNQETKKQGINKSLDVIEQKFNSAASSETASRNQRKVKEKSSAVKRTGGWKIGILVAALLIGFVAWRSSRRLFLSF